MFHFDWKSTSSGKHGAHFLLCFLFAILPLRCGLDAHNFQRHAKVGFLAHTPHRQTASALYHFSDGFESGNNVLMWL